LNPILRAIVIAALGVPGALCAAASRAATVEGRIVEIAADAVYLDRGERDGLKIGSPIEILRVDGDPIAMTVIHITDHHASAGPPPAAGSPAVGDRWLSAGGIDAGPEPQPIPPAPAEPPPDPELLAARWKEALAAPQPLIPFQGASRPRARAPRGVRIHAAALSYPSNVSASGGYAGGRLDVRSTGGLSRDSGMAYRIDLDLSGWGQRSDRSRLRPSADPYLLVHDLAMEIAPRGGSFRAAAGRLRAAQPFAGPLLDGVSASLLGGGGGVAGTASPQARAREIGVYGGLLPDPLDLRPDSRRAAVGVFAVSTASLSEKLAGRFGAAVEMRRFRGSSYETGRVRLQMDRAAEMGIEAGAAAWRESSSLRFGDAHASIRGSKAARSYWLLYRESETAFDAKQREAILEVFDAGAEPARRARRAEAGLSWARSEKTQVSAVAGHAGGDGGLGRWTVEPTLEVRRGIWALRSWRLGYRGSVGWQEGHEADLGGLFAFGRWRLDLRLGGGVLHQSPAARTTPIGRGSLSLRRPAGDGGSISLTAFGHGTVDFIGGAARLAVSKRF
jgi:hypothetical protein